MENKYRYTTDSDEDINMETMDAKEQTIADTIKETDKKCDACGGTMDFNPKKGNLVCPYCGTEKEIKEDNPQFEAQELDFNQAEEQASCDWGTATKTVICKSCGAQTVYDVNQIANECPYCGSNQVMEAGSEAVMAPGGVVLFKLDAKGASERFKRWIGGKFFCPKLAKDSAKPKSFKGMYVPFWTFDSQTISQYSGQYGKNRVVRGHDGKMVTKTTWHFTRGQLSYPIDDILVCASSKQNEAMLKSVEPVRNDKDVKAVVLRVNSPGGSVMASEKIKAELDMLKQNVPVIASYGNYAASGGYWISANCDYIFSNASTLTGSIGVFSMIPDLQGTLKDKLHVNITAVNSNKHADMYGMMRPLDPKEVAYMQATIERIYDRFTEVVSEGRDMSVPEVDAVGQGRVWAGAEAIGIGLVDKIGTIEDAISYAAMSIEGVNSINDVQVVAYPKPQTTLEALMESLGKKESTFESMATGKPLARIPYDIYIR